MYTAIIHDWVGSNVDGKFKLSGKVYGDTKRRYEDGTRIITSQVEAIERSIVGMIAVTASGNRYLLVG